MSKAPLRRSTGYDAFHPGRAKRSRGAKAINKVIWTCWFQGRHVAPRLVQRCISSWEERNPGWEVRCLDGYGIRRYIELPDFNGKSITHTGLSDIVRLLLLQEYGGVWADATLFCNRPLEEWLDQYLQAGFFAFHRPGPDRELSTWFLAAETNHNLVSRWLDWALAYWSDRATADAYHWFHYRFADACRADPAFARDWEAVPKVSAREPHGIQRAGLLQTDSAIIDSQVDWTTPVFKLTYKFDQDRYAPGTLAWELLEEGGRYPPRWPISAGVTGSGRPR